MNIIDAELVETMVLCYIDVYVTSGLVVFTCASPF